MVKDLIFQKDLMFVSIDRNWCLRYIPNQKMLYSTVILKNEQQKAPPFGDAFYLAKTFKN